MTAQHTSEIDLQTATEDERREFFQRAAANAAQAQRDRLATAYGRPVDEATGRAFARIAWNTDGQTVDALVAALAAPFTIESARQYVATLDDTSRDALRDAISEVEDAAEDAAILSIIRAELAEMDHPAGTEPVAVVFETMEFENGYFLYASGTVHYADGRFRRVDFPDGLDDLLGRSYGARGEHFTLAINPATGDAETDDYGDALSLLRLNIPDAPAEQTWTFFGHWEDDKIVVEYYVPGEVEDLRVDTGHWEGGLWADSGSGLTVEEAQAVAVAEYENDLSEARASVGAPNSND